MKLSNKKTKYIIFLVTVAIILVLVLAYKNTFKDKVTIDVKIKTLDKNYVEKTYNMTIEVDGKKSRTTFRNNDVTMYSYKDYSFYEMAGRIKKFTPFKTYRDLYDILRRIKIDKKSESLTKVILPMDTANDILASIQINRLTDRDASCYIRQEKKSLREVIIDIEDADYLSFNISISLSNLENVVVFPNIYEDIVDTIDDNAPELKVVTIN